MPLWNIAMMRQRALKMGVLAIALAFTVCPVRAQTSAPGQMGPGAAQPVVVAPSVITPSPLAPPIAAPPGLATPAAPGTSAPVQAEMQPGIAAPKPKPKLKAAPPREWALSEDPTPSFQPETFFATTLASERYARIVDAGGWPVVPGALQPGAKGKGVGILRKRLSIEGDLPEALAAGEDWDPVLTSAVKHFQTRNGLRPNGIVAGATLKAMNVPARTRFKQLASSAQRLAGTNFSFGDRYVVVNIPSAAVEAVDNGRVVRRYVAVVGDVDHRSPEVEARISAVNLNPTWTVPTSIIKNEIIPKMRRDPGYLARQKIRILDNKGTQVDPARVDWSTERAVNYTLRQDSGLGNSLGSIRIQMNNKHAVYMHDTPSKVAFGRDYRFLSHGCVRVSGVYDLATWLLEGSPGAPGGAWEKSDLQRIVAGGERQDVKLSKIVPVIWVYMTGWASADGTVHFADDVYNVDSIDLAQADTR